MRKDGAVRQLVNARNTRHQTVEALDAAIGYDGMIRTLITAAESRGRLPRADLINALADELDDTRPVEVLLAFARDAGVRMPNSVQAAGITEIWLRIVALPAHRQQAIRDMLSIIVAELEPGA